MLVGTKELLPSIPTQRSGESKAAHAEDVVARTAAYAEFAALSGDTVRATELSRQAEVLSRSATFLALRDGLETVRRK